MRSGISIVPQSPDLFEGTIRENIDPTGVSQDADIWVALEQVRQSYSKTSGSKLTSVADSPTTVRGISAGRLGRGCEGRRVIDVRGTEAAAVLRSRVVTEGKH